ncbi:MAG: ribosomal-processing cysteine protease Prp [Lachnospiraceae bacterium]|nr:ribosomal-processing cysteine protease Prp [Lachnospiraceae bacterium]
MITVKIEKGKCKYKLCADGHAGYGKAGQDIVCAGVSSLLYALTAGLEEIPHTHEQDILSVRMGHELKWKPSESVWVWKVINAIEKGLSWIADQYPENLKVEVKTMNKCNNQEKVKEIAEKLNGIAYGEDVSRIEKEAKENGIVIVMGASDDLMEFSGAIMGEGSCYEGGEVYFDRDGVSYDDTERANVIEALWCDSCDEDGIQATWSYKTEIPHETFKVFEDEELYCIGIVFSVEDME